MIYREFDNRYGLNRLFNVDLNNPAYLKQAFAVKAIVSIGEILDELVAKIKSDKRLENSLDTKEDIDQFKKTFSRFSIYIMVFSYSQLLKYIFELILKIKEKNIPLDIAVEYYMFFMVRFLQWATDNFALNSSEKDFYNKKICSVLFLFTKSGDDSLINDLEELLDSMPANTPLNVQMVEIELFASLQDSVTKDNISDLIKLSKKYLAQLQLIDQRGSDKIASLLAKIILVFEQNSALIISNKNSNIYISDLMEKFAFYTADSEFAQASLPLHYLDMQIEFTLFRVFLRS